MERAALVAGTLDARLGCHYWWPQRGATVRLLRRLNGVLVQPIAKTSRGPVPDVKLVTCASYDDLSKPRNDWGRERLEQLLSP